ncbi:MAG TPA: OmpH family outer membrane protein [Candidatus Hydrogenedentes bacterium]|nr:OmpH family outer membrane protein [Candidatus Hydrogenedentota bacterium]
MSNRMMLAGVFFSFSLMLGLSLISGGNDAFAQDNNATASQSGGYKIAVVDVAQLMAESKKRKQKYEELQKEVDRLQQELDALQKKIDAAKKSYDEKKSTMTDEERATMRTQIENDLVNYQVETKKRQNLIDNQEELVLKEVAVDIQAAVARVSEQEGYHLVLNASGGLRAPVVYHSPTVDITSKVLAIINQ